MTPISTSEYQKVVAKKNPEPKQYGLKELISILTVIGMISAGIIWASSLVREEVREHAKSEGHNFQQVINAHREQSLDKAHPAAVSRETLNAIMAKIDGRLQRIDESLGRLSKKVRSNARRVRNDESD